MCTAQGKWSYRSSFDSKAVDLGSIPGCSCLGALAGPSITSALLALTFRQAQTSKNKPAMPSTEVLSYTRPDRGNEETYETKNKISKIAQAGK